MNTQIEHINNEGVKYFLSGNLSDAKLKYNEALQISPKHPTTLNNMGMLLMKEKKYKQAIPFFNDALKEKQHATYYLNLGHAYANQKLLDRAEACYVEAIKVDSKSLGAFKSLGTLYSHRKEFYKAIEVWQEVLQNYSSDVQYMILLAKDLIAISEFNKALFTLEEATKQEKNLEISWYYIALIQFQLKNFGSAENAIKRSLAIVPDNTDFRALAAVIYLATSDTGKAMQQWNYALNVDPNNHKIRMDKVITLLSQGLLDEATENVNFVLKADPLNESGNFYKALLLLEKNKNDKKGLELLNEIAQSDGLMSVNAEHILNNRN